MVNKTDVAFIIAGVSQVLNVIQQKVDPLVSPTVSSWLGIAFSITTLLLFLYYEKLTNTVPVPVPPQIGA